MALPRGCGAAILGSGASVGTAVGAAAATRTAVAVGRAGTGVGGTGVGAAGLAGADVSGAGGAAVGAAHALAISARLARMRVRIGIGSFGTQWCDGPSPAMK